PIGKPAVMLFRTVETTVLELDARVFSKRHRVAKKKTIRRLDAIFCALRVTQVGRSHGMPSKWQRHRATTPVVATESPLFGPRSLRLRRVAVVEEKPGIALECPEVGVVGKGEACPDESAAPISATLVDGCIEQHVVVSADRCWKVMIGGVE